MTTPRTQPALREQLDDSDVVTRVLNGDSAVFEILMRRHNQRMYRVARAVLRTDDEVEDVLQQAYLNAYQKLHQFAGGSEFSTWLTRIVLNEALARRRKRGSAFAGGEDEITLTLMDTKTPDPEHQAASSELREVLEDEIGSLPDALRLVFVMRDVEGLSTAQAADCLTISQDLVKTRLHRARAALRDSLYRRAGVTIESIFAFGNVRCDRVVANVMRELQPR